MTSFPTSIGPEWLELIDGVARRRLGARDRTGDALAAAVRAVSDVYTRRSDRAWASVKTSADDVLAARLRFFLPRDLPKVAGPIRELAWAGALPSRRPIRVLDVGAGLGTTTLGALDALRSSGLSSDDVLEVTALDGDTRALSIFSDLAEALGAAPWARDWPRARISTAIVDLSDPTRLPAGPFDLVLAGLALNEIFPVERHGSAPTTLAHALRALASRLSPDGSLVVIEPALAATSRALHEARDAVLATPSDLCVFAPCPHDDPCPMLERPRDWCHEDETVVLPPSLAAVARAAGLRFEGLTFSYLVLRRDGRTLASEIARRTGSVAGDVVVRIVGGARPSKGKTTITGCARGGRVELVELSRDVGREGMVGSLARGDVLVVERPEGGGSVRLARGTAPIRARPSSRSASSPVKMDPGTATKEPR